MSRLLSKLTYANVVATLALVIAVGGGAAIAANSLPKNSVKAKQIAKEAVKNSKIAKDAVTGDKVNESTLGKVPLATHADTAITAGSAASATNAAHATVADSLGGSVSASNVARVQSASSAGFSGTSLDLDVPGFGSWWLYCRPNTPSNEDDVLTFNEQGNLNAVASGLLAASAFPGPANEVSVIDGLTVEPNASREYGTNGRRLYVHFLATVFGTGKTIEITGGGYDDTSTPGCVGHLRASITG